MAALAPVPHPREWPPEVRELIARRMLKKCLAVWGPDDAGRKAGWERLLVAVYSGGTRRGERVPYALSLEQAWAFALEDLAGKGEG